ncbi:MAG: right-handed parallel beta-helix repeat-containing protein, partial [Myxococcales bacterium]
LDGARLELRQVAVTGCRDAGVIADHAELTMHASAIHGCTYNQNDFDGTGVTLNRAVATIHGSDVAGNQSAGIDVRDGSTLTLEASVVRGTKQGKGISGGGLYVIGSGLSLKDSAIVGNESMGLVLLERASALVERTALLGNRHIALVASDATLTAAHLTVEDTLPAVERNEFGVGLLVSGALTLRGALVRGNRYAGLAFDGGPTQRAITGSVEDSLVSGTRGDGTGFGHGVVVKDGATLSLRGTQLRRNANVGLVVANGAAAVAGGGLLDNATALHAQDGTTVDEVAQLPEAPGEHRLLVQRDVEVRGNGTRIGAGQLPLPDPFASVPPPP